MTTILTNNEKDDICRETASPDNNCKHDSINCTYRPLYGRCGYISSQKSEHTLENAACIENANKTGTCQNIEINGETIYCGWDDNSGDCKEVPSDQSEEKLPDVCFRRSKDCALTDSRLECGRIEISEKNCEDMLSDYINIVKKDLGRSEDKQRAQDDLDGLMEDCVKNPYYICTDKDGKIFPNPDDNEQIKNFINSLSDDNKLHPDQVRNMMFAKINSTDDQDNDQDNDQDKDDSSSSTGKKISKKDLLLIIGGSSLGLVIIILVILLIIKSRN